MNGFPPVHANDGYTTWPKCRTMAIMVDGGSPPRNGVATLDTNRAKSRFGVAYVRAVCSQAGVGFQETSPDEDVLAVDANVEFEIAPAKVQVKCTGQFRLKGGATATWPIEEAWRQRWKRSGLPVYFVLVIVDPDDQAEWLHHQDEATLHRAAAFWVRVDTLPVGQNIVVPKAQRLTVDTLLLWAADVEASFDGARGGGVVA
ncbi:DUF4365 domain-containing protein [Amycolatopsis magusensis]|uniref:DUF4365 domain-containing protein n=1 Tax=Amycolatopsis magusensis TaxID=882444 RepID=UPI0037972395